MIGAWRLRVGAGVVAALLWGCDGDGPRITSLPDGGSAGSVELTGGAGGEGGTVEVAGAGGAGDDGGAGGEGRGAAAGSAGLEATNGGAGGAAGAAVVGGAASGGVAGGGEGGGRASSLAIIGTYTDDWGYLHVIDGDTWIQGGSSRFELLDFSNEERWAVALNAATNEWSPGAYSRFDWTVAGSTLWYCQTAYDAPTLEQALATAPADAADPEAGGCGGAPWSRLTPD